MEKVGVRIADLDQKGQGRLTNLTNFLPLLYNPLDDFNKLNLLDILYRQAILLFLVFLEHCKDVSEQLDGHLDFSQGEKLEGLC